MKYTVHVDFHKDHLQVEEDTIHIGLMANPVKGKANKELIKKLAKHFKVPSCNIKILAGYTSRTKLIEVVKTT